MKLLRVLVVLATVGCGSGDDTNPPPGGADGGGGAGASCTVTATTAKVGSTIEGRGSVSCSKAANLTIDVCLNWRSPGESAWTELQCYSGNQSATATLDGTTSVMAGFSAKEYQTVVDASADGASLARKTSDVVTAPMP